MMQREPNNVFNVDDFFDLSKKVAKVQLRGGAVMGREVPRSDIFLVPPSPVRSVSNFSYADEYIAMETRSLLEGGLSSNSDDLVGRSSMNPESVNLCDVEELTSVGSVANMADVETDDFTRIYQTYRFDPPPSKGLLIEADRDRIVRMIQTNQVVVIQGPTGCGKSTQVPQYILDYHANCKKRCNIIVTQPRRIAAASVAKRVCAERGWDVGTIVGYQIGMDNMTSPDTRLSFCTTGVLREKLVKDRSMMAYTHVILDEVHERDIDMDFLMLVVRKLLRTNSRTVKVILMSATISCKQFCHYFALPINDQLVDAPALKVSPHEGRFKVNEHYLNELHAIGPLPAIDFEKPYIDPLNFDVAVRLIKVFDKIDRQQFHNDHKRIPCDADNYKHAVLVFLPGLHEIEELYNRLEQTKEDKFMWHIIPLHSSITKVEQEQVFKHCAPGYRKVILSTNIAESSITVPDVAYVIDFCLTKHLVCDPDTNFTSLHLSWASRSNCTQRKGRAGRVKDGRVYRMVPEEFFLQLPEKCLPEMLRCPLEQTVLKAKLLNMGEPKALLALAMDPPDLSHLERTMLLLKEAGAMLPTCEGKLSRFDGDVTFLGHVMAHMPLEIHLTKLIMLGHIFSILEDCIVIAAFMSVRNVFSHPFHSRLAAYGTKLSYSMGTCSDCIAYLRVHTMFKEKLRTNYFRTSNTDQETFCKRHFLNLRAMYEANLLVEELRKRLQSCGIAESTANGRVAWDAEQLPIIRKIVIAGAFYPNYFVRGAQGGQVDGKDAVKMVAGMDPCNSVYLQGMPANQPGKLYTRVFKDALKECGKVADVTFDGSSKVYVQFERLRDTHLPGKVSISVYRAVRMRQLRIPVEVYVLNSEEAKRRVEKLGVESSRFLSFNEQPKSDTRSILPDMSVEIIEFTPCHIDNPNRFWIHSGIEEDLKWVMESLNKTGNLLNACDPIQIGGIYAAPYPADGKIIYRAKVLRTWSDKVKVFYIDYGNEGFVTPKNLFEISPVLLDKECLRNLPPLAMECTLTGVDPCPLSNANGIWCAKVNEKFQKLMNFNTLFGEVYSVIDGVVSLVVKNPGNEISVNDQLIQDKVAIRVRENYRSEQDHEARCEASGYGNTSSKGACSNVLQMNQDFCNGVEDLDPPSKLDKTRKIILRGPMNPLEMKVYGCTKVATGKETSMDPDSVNAALLDTDPDDPHERLLVAASVAQNPGGNRLKLCHTTLMPNMHGLAALLCLIFAPKMELRRSRDKTRYVGALCGLGWDPSTGQSYFPEHDMEIVFDCEMDLETDVLLVNKLRYWMNVPLHAQTGSDAPEATAYEVLQSQQRVADHLIKLLKKDRPTQSVEMYSRPYRWKQYAEEDRLDPGLHDSNLIYAAHWGLRLELEDPMSGKLVESVTSEETKQSEYRRAMNLGCIK